ncbi:1-acyl-sn-glycerol-3-phosphate acyltransferase [bacterium]|nr:1-acyl-sn-glycerol-3-phosphate acyltransferase [bacterium]
MTTKLSGRNEKTFNFWRKIFQYFAAKMTAIHFIKLKFKVLKPEGMENIDKTKNYVVASNHLSNYDPFFIASQLNNPLAYMAKKELFSTFWLRLVMDWCGAFAVDREKVDVSTIKTALSVKKTDWDLGIFPQGTRSHSNELVASKGFASIAKKMGREILPVGIIKKADEKNPNGKQLLYIKVGKPISTEGDVDDIYNQWCKTICELTGLEYKSNQTD